MEVQDPETHAQKTKSERYGKIAIVLFLLLALFWAIGAFVIWILLGAAVYFTFLYFYYQPRQPKTESWRSSQYGSYSSDDPDDIKKKAKLVVQIVIGFFVFLFVFFFIVGVVSQDNTSEDNTIISDVSEESANNNVQVLKHDPNNIDALTGIGNQFFDQSNYDSALLYYNKVLKIEPTNSAALYNIGLVYYNQKQYQQSIDLLKKCISVDPDNRDAKYIMGHN
ncbi:MAG TPA: tetratricopeptide repeat protein, partial [Cyclobacteriaceae bacterium]